MGVQSCANAWQGERNPGADVKGVKLWIVRERAACARRDTGCVAMLADPDRHRARAQAVTTTSGLRT